MTKIVFLSVTCDLYPIFKNETEIIENTWGKDIIDGIYPGCKYYTVRQGSRNKIVDNTIYTDCGDFIEDTYDKLKLALQILIENNIEFDIVVKTNTCTFLNIPRIIDFINDLGINAFEGIQIGCIINLYRYQDNCNILSIVGGHFMILTANQCEMIATEINDINALRYFKGCRLELYDDHIVARILHQYYGDRKYIDLRFNIFNGFNSKYPFQYSFTDPKEINHMLFAYVKSNDDNNCRNDECNKLLQLYNSFNKNY